MEERLRQDVEARRWIDASRGGFGRCRRGCPDPNGSGEATTRGQGDSGGIPNLLLILAANQLLLSALFRSSGPTISFSPLLISRTAPCGFAQRTLGAARRLQWTGSSCPASWQSRGGLQDTTCRVLKPAQGVLGLGSQTSPEARHFPGFLLNARPLDCPFQLTGRRRPGP